MLARTNVRAVGRVLGARMAPRAAVYARRFVSSEPNQVYTRINDAKDPQRNQFFQYSWGTWLKHNDYEKARRETRFSIEGVTNFVNKLQASDGKIHKPEVQTTGAVVLSHNITTETIGQESGNELESIASIHEGKHHRVYKLTTKNGKSLVLRIPYKLDSDHAIERKIKSEVATLDFLRLKLDANVPRVLAYGANRNNSILSPFILMEHIEGDLLMKQWNPLTADEADNAALKKVIDPVMDFQDKLLSVSFNASGSLYFHDDVTVEQQQTVPYDGETNDDLKNRWRIGPTAERVFSRNKKHMSAKEVDALSGPWSKDQPLEVVQAVGKIELESLKSRLALAQADSGNQVENIDELKAQIEAFDHFVAVGDKLINPASPSIMNVEELFKPKLYAPDLDPLNIIVDAASGKPYFVDFEHTVIKPFAFTQYPGFVAYQGAKVYNLEEDVPGYKEMEEAEQQQYQFMYYKTRNERLWEFALNAKRHDLIAVASPHLKLLKAPYIQALDVKNNKDYMFVENAIVQLQAMWETYVANQLCNTSETKFPVEYTQEFLDKHAKGLEDYQLEVVSTPFAATGGWVPQNMFDMLKQQGILVEDDQGNHSVKTEAAL